MLKPEFKGKDQVAEYGKGDLVFEAVFRDEHGQPVEGVSVKCVQTEGDGELEQDVTITDHTGEVCAIFKPDGKTSRGRVEMLYGENEKLVHVEPFLYTVVGIPEPEAASLPLSAAPVASTIAEASVDSPEVKPITVEPVEPESKLLSDLRDSDAGLDRCLELSKALAAAAPRPPAQKPAAEQTGKGVFLAQVTLQQAAMAGFIIVVLGLLTTGVIKRLKPQEQAKLDLIVDCSKAPPAKWLGNGFVRDCLLYRK